MTRQGLKRLGCVDDCGCIAYMTLAQLERFGMPACPCGAGMVPESLEVAAAVMPREQLEQLPAWREHEREASRVHHGQASHIQRGRSVRDASLVAAERLEAARRHEAHARRLSGLVQFKQAAQVAADMPF
jgi:hypothetical protein